ncbi:MAG TPA: Gldg family protein [Methylomirabilota bacterium]|nr:Gldg family protein [Methylomirabilota bacterium]
MKQKKFETLLYSAIGIAVMFVVIVAVNLISNAAKARMDLTEDKLYTLSPGTKAILKKLDSPVEARFYFSQSESRVPSQIRTYASEVEDLLEEFREVSGGKIRIRRIDPKPDSDAEEAAQADGVEAQASGPLGENFYFGLIISSDPEKALVPLPLERERLLEYDIARALGQVISTTKPVVGVMTGLPMFGAPSNPMMMRMGQRGQRPWVFIQELKRDYTVKQVEMEVDQIEDDIQVLIVAHPKNITDKAQYAIDQFVLRGGKLLGLLDAMCFIDRDQSQPNNPLAGMMPGGGSSLPRLLQAWGVAFESTKVVADLGYTREISFQEGQPPRPMPTFLFVNPEGINKEDIVTAQIDNLLLAQAGSFSGTAATGLKQTVLLHTTKKSELVDGMTAQFSPQKIMDDFKASNEERPLAIRLQGKFKTAFPEGKPATPPADGEEKKDEAKPADNSLKESKTDGVVILIGDADFLFDNFCVQINPLFGIATPINGNLGLAQNMVEQLSGDANLVGTRSRGALRRPFTVMQRMQAEAEDAGREKIQKLNQELQNAQNQLNELQAKKEPGQKLILSPEQQSKIAEFQKKQRDTQRELRDLRKNLRQDIDSLENRLKWANIAGVPGLVILAGLGTFFIRKQRTKAQ